MSLPYVMTIDLTTMTDSGPRVTTSDVGDTLWGMRRRPTAPAGVMALVIGFALASRASRVRARVLFMVLDSVAVVAAYSVAEVTYFRGHPSSLYWRHFALFLVMALLILLTANAAFGLYGRISRYAGIEEARQVLVSALPRSSSYSSGGHCGTWWTSSASRSRRYSWVAPS